MKYKFNTLEEVKTAIEQWFITLGYDNKERAEKQYLKCIAELGEVADEICKERTTELKLEIGDLGVTIIGLALQRKETIFYRGGVYWDLKDTISNIVCELNNELLEAFGWYSDLVYSLELDILECLTLAYNKIQKRLEDGKLSIKNGTIVK